MENRFGIKDLFIFTLLLVVIVLCILEMIQVDRQWTSIQNLQEESKQQDRDLIEIRRTLAEGISVGTPTTQSVASTTQPSGDPFRVLTEAEKMPGFARGDWLVENLGAKVKSITPFIGNDVYAAYLQARVTEGLLYRDFDTLNFVPLLAKSWTISPDGKTITFNLRRGITFSDGEPFTADDVVFTYKFILNPQINAPRDRSSLDLLQDVKKIDDYTVEFTFKSYYFKSLEVVGGEGILPKHFYSKYKPEDFNESTGLLMGTGPYKLENPTTWSPGQPLILVRNDRYWGEQPAPNRLVYREVEEETASQTMFINGEDDIFGATAEQFNKMKGDPKILARATPMDYLSMLAGYFYVGWNEKNHNAPSIFADKRVRQAMTMLVDRDAICRDVFLGYATVPSGPFAPASKQADHSLKPFPYDPARAKALLREVGIYDRDGDGVLDTPDGKPFRFKLTYGTNSAVYDRITLFMKDGFAKAGIIMERDPVEWPVLQKKLDQRDFDAIFLGWSGAVDDDPYQMFHSSQIADQGDNFISYSSPECDAALIAARSTIDETQRNQLWHKVDDIITNDCPYTFMTIRRTTIFIDKRWQNVRRSTMGINYNRLDFSPLPWFVPKNEQKYSD